MGAEGDGTHGLVVPITKDAQNLPNLVKTFMDTHVELVLNLWRAVSVQFPLHVPRCLAPPSVLASLSMHVTAQVLAITAG
jgi:hypothetical protein